jgi:HEAT repeat protein
LLRHNDTSALDEAVDTLLNPPPDVPKNLVDGLGYSIRAGIKDPQAVPALMRLLGSPEAEKRRIATIALGQTHSRAAAASLTKALNDPDQEVRYNAVTGLAQVTGETDGMPSLEFFKQNEQHYLAHWRERMKKK